MTAIPCGACGHHNDPTRVFCQNCGVRLDKSAEVEVGEDGAVSETPAGTPPPSPIQYRAEYQTLPQKKKGTGALKMVWIIARELAVTAALAFVLACLVQMLRAPTGIPPATAPVESSASFLAADLQAARENPYPRSVVVTANQANNFLAARLSPGTSEGWPPVTFARAFVVPGNGDVIFRVQQAYLGLPVYLSLTLVPEHSNGGTTAKIIAGKIGRLPVPDFLLPKFAASFDPTFGALRGPADWFGSAESIVVTPEGATINWRGKTH